MAEYNHFDQFLDAYKAKSKVPVWLKNLTRTLVSKNITIEDWNDIVMQIRYIASDSVSVYDYINAFVAAGFVFKIKGSAEEDFRQGEVIISPEDLNLGNVDNTSDKDKPLSTAQINALNALNSLIDGLSNSKLDISTDGGFAAYTHVGSTQTQTGISQSALKGFIVQRISGGQITVPETHSNKTDATSKKYVDERDDAIKAAAVSEANEYANEYAEAARNSAVVESFAYTTEEQNRAIAAEDALSQRIEAQEGLGGFLDAHNFGKATPTQGELDAYALSQIPTIEGDKHKIWNSTRVTNLFDNNVWQLTNTQNTVPAVYEWTNIGSAMVSRATQNTLGIVKGSSSVSVESDGSLKATAASIGAVAEVLVGETVTLDPEDPAEVENVGTGTTPILKFKIPKGNTGEKGEKGEKGDEPVKGIDYWTESDKMEIIQAVVDVMDGALIGYVDSNNNIILIGGLEGEVYTVKYKMDDDNLIDIGELVLVGKYTVTNNLTNCTTSNASEEIVDGNSYSAIITANEDYVLASVTVIMGGADITSTAVSGGTISIASVTGDIVITALAEPAAVINQIPISIDASGNPFNGGTGWKTGYRLSLSRGAETEASGYEVTGFIPVTYGDVLRIKNIDLKEENSTNIVFYDSAKVPLGTGAIHGGQLYIIFVTSGTESNGVYTSPPLNSSLLSMIDNNLAYIRIGSPAITNESILTVNQEIV